MGHNQRNNACIIGIPEGEQKEKGAESIFNATEENLERKIRPPVLRRTKRAKCYSQTGLPKWHSGKESNCQCRRCKFDPWARKIPWNRKWQPISVLLPRQFHGQRSLASYSPWVCREWYTTECVHGHTYTGLHWYTSNAVTSQIGKVTMTKWLLH